MIEVQPLVIEYLVRGYDCGYGGPLQPLALANFFQEAAGIHASTIGIGMAELAAQGRTWMLSRLDIRIDSTPAPGDRVEVLTWPAGTKGIFALRDLVLRAAGGGPVHARAVYAYLVVDIAARRPLRPDRCFGNDLPVCTRPHPVPDFSFSVPRLESEVWKPVRTIIASPRHIDYNGHVNNAYILSWLVDAVPRDCRCSLSPVLPDTLAPDTAPSSPSRLVGSEPSGSMPPGRFPESPDSPGSREIPLPPGSLKSLKVEFTSELLEADTVDASCAMTPEGSALTRLVRSGETVASSRSDWT